MRATPLTRSGAAGLTAPFLPCRQRRLRTSQPWGSVIAREFRRDATLIRQVFSVCHRFAQAPARQPIVLGVKISQTRQQFFVDIRPSACGDLENHRHLAGAKISGTFWLMAHGRGRPHAPVVPRGKAARARD